MARRGAVGADQSTRSRRRGSSDAGRAGNRAAAESHRGSRRKRQPPQTQQPQQPSAHEESTLPLGATPRPMEGTNLPSTPGGTENKPGSTKPTIEGGLPGLLPEPEPNKPSNPVPPANPPAKPPAKELPKSSLREDGSKLANSSNVTVIYPAQLANARFGPQKVWQKDNQPPAPVTRDIRADAVVALAGNMEPERNASLPGAHHADAIGVTPGSSAAAVEPAAYALAESPPKPAAVSRAALPSVALGGYCPVELSENGRWVLGDLRWTVVHRGWIYRLSGPSNGDNSWPIPTVLPPSIPAMTSCCRQPEPQRPRPDGLLRHLRQSSVHVLQRGHAGRIQQKPGTVRDTKVVEGQWSGQSAVRSR